MNWVKFGEILAVAAAVGGGAFFCGVKAARIKAWWPFVVAGAIGAAGMLTVSLVVVPQ